MNVRGPFVLSEDQVKSAAELASRVFGKDMAKAYPNLLSDANAINLAGFESEGQIVALVGMLPADTSVFGHILRVGLIGAVCTDRKLRGKGLAYAALRFSEELAVKQGISVFLISGTGGIYSRLGAVVTESFGRKAVRPFDHEELNVREASEEDISAMLKMYAGHSVRFIRSYESFRRSFSSGYCMDKSVKTYLSESAYLSLFVEGREGAVLEHGGPFEDVVALAEKLTSAEGLEKTEILLSGHYKERFDATCPFPGTIKVISEELALNQLNDYFGEFCSASAREKLLSRLAATGLTELTEMLFGVRPETPECLPIPLPVYGWNYI